jgi:hypothetical protein
MCFFRNRLGQPKQIVPAAEHQLLECPEIPRCEGVLDAYALESSIMSHYGHNLIVIAFAQQVRDEKSTTHLHSDVDATPTFRRRDPHPARQFQRPFIPFPAVWQFLFNIPFRLVQN